MFVSARYCGPPFRISGESCLYVSNTSVLWPEAKTGCENLNAQLVTIKSQQKQDDVANFIESYFGKLFLPKDVGQFPLTSAYCQNILTVPDG